MVLRALQTPKEAEVLVADPQNKDPLDLARDAMLEHMQDRHQKESRSSSAASRSSSTGKWHQSSSQSRDEVDPKKWHLMPDQESPTPDWESLAPAHRFTLNWDQNILEPLKPQWKLATRDAPVTPGIRSNL